MNSLARIAGLLAVLTMTACGAGDPAGPSSTHAADDWQFELKLTVDPVVAASRDDAELTVEIVNGIGEAPNVVHHAPFNSRSVKIDLNLETAVGIDMRINGALALAIERPYWEQIYNGSIEVRIRRGGFTLRRKILKPGCVKNPTDCRQVGDRIHVAAPGEVLDEIRDLPIRIRTTRRLTDLIGGAELVVRLLPADDGEERVILQQQLGDKPERIDETLELERGASLQVSLGNTHSVLIPPDVWMTTWDKVTVTLDDEQITVRSRILVGQRLQPHDDRYPVNPLPAGSAQIPPENVSQVLGSPVS